ncbi:MAG TPA: uracil phosphoribosyltransferase [Chitinophagaceae bacterium]|nr:uracil phosphoribosyltransferase [Chitinophagaceae bacterium]
MIIRLSETHSLVGQWLSEIRDVSVQGDRMRFRRNLERFGEVAAFEISKQLEWVPREITTPLGVAICHTLRSQPVIATILRAGIPLQQGLLNYFDQADGAFVSAYRHHPGDDSFQIVQEYVSGPPLEGRVLILADPMLATGASMVRAIRSLREAGEPRAIHVVAAIATTSGLEAVQAEGEKILIWAGDIDEQLNARGYIVPGLGDAGDLAYGPKFSN